MRWCGMPDKAYRFGDAAHGGPSLRERRRRRTKTAKRRVHATKVRAVHIVVGLRAEVCLIGTTALR